jgi:hypothetical protein
MTHFYEKNIVEIKNEYTTYLIDILTPLLYEGIRSVYDHAVKQSETLDNLIETNQTNKNPGIIKLFQLCLKDIPSLNQNAVDVEARRIKEFSRCSEWFDDLVKAVVKSYIILMTYNATGKTCKLVQEKHHEKINVNEFIHKCYIECSNTFYNNPELFWTEHSKETLQICKNMAYKFIKQAITDAIHKMLPIKQILQEYLSNDYIIEPIQKVNNFERFSPRHKEVKNGCSLLVTDENKHSDNDETKLVETSSLSPGINDSLEEKQIREQIEQLIKDDPKKEDITSELNPQIPKPQEIIKKQENIQEPNNIVHEQHEKNDGENINKVSITQQEQPKQPDEEVKEIDEVNEDVADKIITEHFNKFFNDNSL